MSETDQLHELLLNLTKGLASDRAVVAKWTDHNFTEPECDEESFESEDGTVPASFTLKPDNLVMPIDCYNISFDDAVHLNLRGTELTIHNSQYTHIQVDIADLLTDTEKDALLQALHTRITNQRTAVISTVSDQLKGYASLG